MVILTDNDILFKLGACNLLGAFPDLFGVHHKDIYILPTAKPVLQKSLGRQARLQRYTYEGIERAIAFADAVSVLDDTLACIDELEYDLMASYSGLDPGEVILFAASACFEKVSIVTGDRRCVTALAKADDCAPIRERVEGTVYCLEQVIMLAINQLGFEKVKAHIAPSRQCDGWLSICFSAGLLTPKEHALNGLSSAVHDIEQAAPGLLSSI